MRKINVLILITMMLALSLPVSATMIAYWDMADAGAADQALMPGNASREAADVPPAGFGPEDFLISSTDLTGNGNHLAAWTSAWMKWTATSFQGDFAMEATNGYPDSRTDSAGSMPGGIDLETITPAQWTVECVFQATAGTNRCMVGRVGYQIPGAANQSIAAFYLAERSNQRINCEYVDVTGAYFNAISPNATLVAGTWYHAAAVSDGTTLTLYLKNLTADTDYQVVATADLSTSADPSIVRDPDSGVWTVACGTYNNGTGDRFVSPGKIDMVAISDEALAPGLFAYETGPINYGAAYDPDPQPLNIDGTVGTLAAGQASLTLNFKAGKDPNTVRDYPVNPDILKHYVWIGTDPESLALHGTVDQVHNADPMLTDPDNAYGPISLDQNTDYYWQVEEGLDNGTGNAYAAGDPNNILGAVWSFKTVAAIPVILTHPRPAVADASGNASFSVTASATATTYQWFKEAGDPDTQLSDGGIYSGTQTATLTITGATLADEGQYYCIAYNGTTPSTPSGAAWLVMPRLVGYWKLDGDMTDSVASEVPGAAARDGFMNSGDPNYVSETSDSGIDGNAMRFYNDGQFMELPGADFFNFYEDGFTISFWFKRYADAGWRLPMSKFDLGQSGWLFGTDANPYDTFIIESPWTGTYGDSTPSVIDGQWHMLTVTYDPADTTIRMYTDGDQDADTGTVNLSTAPLPARPVQIGGDNAGGTGNAIDAAIDEIRMYSYPLTPTEIALMYNGFRPDEFICVETIEGFGTYDLNDDCRVNLADFALVASEWLECQRIPTDACTW